MQHAIDTVTAFDTGNDRSDRPTMPDAVKMSTTISATRGEVGRHGDDPPGRLYPFYLQVALGVCRLFLITSKWLADNAIHMWPGASLR
jgi:hypothetical protein